MSHHYLHFCKSSLIRSALRSGSSRWLATEATPSTSQTPPPPTTSADPKLNKIVDEISGLTLLQAADLVSLLKVRIRDQCCNLGSAESYAPVSPDSIFKKLPCQPLPLHRLLLLPLNLLRRYVESGYYRSSD